MPERSARRVLLANISLAMGGLERQLLLLAENLPADWDVRIWTIEGGPFDRPVHEAGIPWRCRPRRRRFDATPALDLWWAIRSWRPDIVHVWHWMPAAAAVPACLATGTPLIDGSIRIGSRYHDFGRPRRTIMRGANLVVANSQAGLDAWSIGARKGRVIYNAFDNDRLRTARSTSAVIDRGHERFTVVMAARMDPQKDFRTVIGAARYLIRGAPGRWRFLLVGDGEDRAALEARARDLVATGDVEFQNAGIEAIGAIRSADVGILTTDPAVQAEGCSNSILEYMACGLPVVCSDAGGNPELVRDGQEGYLIAPCDVPGLAAKLAYLRAHPGVCARMGAAGRARVEQDFTISRMVAAYLHVYEEALEMRRGQ